MTPIQAVDLFFARIERRASSSKVQTREAWPYAPVTRVTDARWGAIHAE